jgi:Zn finger protein HypA/HybF involved in hydrogenase expression
MTIDLQSGVVHCKDCGYQPLHEWRRTPPEAQYLQIHPFVAKGIAKAKSEMIECPNCGGDDLEPIAGQDAVRCPQCETIYPIKPEQYHLPQSLRGVYVKRQGQAVIWNIVERIIDCPSCGARSTISSHELTNICPFCDSKHAIIQDNHETFEAPHRILPFELSARQARQLVEEKLQSGLHGWTRLFRDKVVRVTGKPMYLPWWLFEVNVDVYWRYRQAFLTSGKDTHLIQLDPLYASLSNRNELSQLAPFDLSKLRDYQPDYLTQIQAELYQIEVHEAAPIAIDQAIKIASDRVRAKRPATMRASIGDTPFGTVRARLMLSPHAKEVKYQFVLLPVWVALLHEDDGDTRRALVNGQTGEVHLEGNALWGIFGEGKRRTQVLD